MLHNSGFSDVWYFPESVNETMFIPLLRQRLRDSIYHTLAYMPKHVYVHAFI